MDCIRLNQNTSLTPLVMKKRVALGMLWYSSCNFRMYVKEGSSAYENEQLREYVVVPKVLLR